MIFPLWFPSSANTGLFIGIISVVHIFVAHFAVGGGFFLFACEHMALKERSSALFDWTEKHSKFFLLITMVFGALTGVALWQVLTLTAPAGSAFLLREFLFFWLAEWLFFLAEIIALLFYVHHFSSVRQGKMAPNQHMVFAALYAIFAFLSLVTVNGIVSFMLTPGEWVHTKNIWDAFFNPSYWPALVFRFSLSLLLAGLFGLITATNIKDAPLRHIAVRKCAHWVLLPSIALMASTYWYNACLSPEIQANIAERTSYMRPFVRSFLDTLPIIFLGGIILLIRMPRMVSRPLTVVLLICGLIITGSFEWVRESARRPWVIYGYMYSNGLTPEQGQELNEQGLMQTTPWARLIINSMHANTNSPNGALAHNLANEVGSISAVALDSPAHNATAQTPAHNAALQTPEHSATQNNIPKQNTIAQNTTPQALKSTISDQTASEHAHIIPNFAPIVFDALPRPVQEHYGKLVFTQQCSPCHGVNAPRLDIVPLLQNRGSQGINALLHAQGRISPYMPPFFGTDQDRKALTTWLSTFTPQVPAETLNLTTPLVPPLNPFDMETSQYILTGFSTQGMLHTEGSKSMFRFSTNATNTHTFGNTIVAQLILRDTTPQMVTEGVNITYTFLNPNLLFNENSPYVKDNILTKDNYPDTHTTQENKITGSSPRSTYYSGTLTRKDASTSFESQPIPIYPHTSLNIYNPYPVAKIEAKDSAGTLLAVTHVVISTSSELGCKNCHGDATQENREDARTGGISKFTSSVILATHDKRNKTTLHQDLVNETAYCASCHDGQKNMHLSTAIHGFHATMGLMGNDACANCHPANQAGKTYMQRDIHALWGLSCTTCHGTLLEHSTGLLKYDAKIHEAAQNRLDLLTENNATSEVKNKTAKVSEKDSYSAQNAENTLMIKDIQPRKAWEQQPDCTTCHDFSKKPESHAANAFNTWVDDKTELFANRYENTNSIRCGSCHSSPHATWPAENPLASDLDNMVSMQYQGFSGPLGANNNCQVCHTVPMEYSVHHDLVEQ